jgi:hypothetical protein
VAFLRFVVEKAAEGSVAWYMHAISFTSAVAGVSSVVLMVIGAQHGWGLQIVSNSIKRVVQVRLSGGVNVVSICADGDCTYTANARQGYAHVCDGRLCDGSDPRNEWPSAEEVKATDSLASRLDSCWKPPSSSRMHRTR